MYNTPVKFSITNCYGCTPDGEDDVYTVDEFRYRVDDQSFTDFDGYGHPVKYGMSDESILIFPSKVFQIPNDATHIVWFNK